MQSSAGPSSELTRRPMPLCLKLHDFKVETAPLASPETLSASSSLALISSAPDGKVYRLQPSFSELETIAQSPEHRVRHEELKDMLCSPVVEPNDEDPLLNKSEGDDLCTSNTDSNLNSVKEKDRCERDDAYKTFNVDAVVTVCETPQPKLDPVANAALPEPAGNAARLGKDLALLSENVSACKHSPDESNQFEYGHPNLHYSPAGTGYPYGAYQPPLSSCKPSSCAPPAAPVHTHVVRSKQPPPMRHCTSAGTLLQPAVAHIRRSPEMTDIAYIEDNAMVFEGAQIKEEMSFDIEQDLQEGGPSTSNTSRARIFDFVTTEAEIV